MLRQNTKKHTEQEIINHLQEVFDQVVGKINNPELRTLVKNFSYIAGGSITSLYTGKTVSDYDFFFTTKESCMQFIKLMNKGLNNKLPVSPLAEVIGNDQKVLKKGIYPVNYRLDDENYKKIQEAINLDEILAITENAITFKMCVGKNSFIKIQFVIKYNGFPENLINKFDFEHCKFYFNPREKHPNNKLESSFQAKQCIDDKRLLFNPGAFEPLTALSRIDKFTKQGYHIKWEDLKCLMLRIMETKTIEEIQEYEGKGATNGF